jgi:SAM-dependent methyltransferase
VTDPWEPLADAFVDGAYATVKGRVRTFVLHQQLLRHLPAPPATVLDVGGGAGHQSFPLARLGYDVTLLDPSAAMLEKARARLDAEPPEVQARVRLVEGDGERAADLGQAFDVVLCHGVLMYLESPVAMLDAMCQCLAPGGLLSVMALNRSTMAVLPALQGRWADALAAFDAVGEVGVLGTRTRADTVDDLTHLMVDRDVDPVAWYGVWLFCDWLELPLESTDVEAVAAVELEASLRDPYRAMSRVFHLVGKKS